MGTLIELFLLALAVGLTSSHILEPMVTFVRNYEESTITCSSECTDGISNGNVVFDENRKYSYLFSGNTTIIAPTETEQGISVVSIEGNANIVGTEKCGAILYLKNLEITHGSKTYSKQELKKLEGNPVLFSYNNGKVGQKICSTAENSAESINLKRAIISSLQVSSIQDQKEFFETDIQGTCNTKYYPGKLSESYLIINKEKDLTQCTGHDKINLMAQPYSIYEDSPFSTATQRSEIQIKDSTLTSVTNEETFIYHPFDAIDVSTRIMACMNLQLNKVKMIRLQKKNDLLSLLSTSRSIMFEKPTEIIGSADANALVAATQSALTKLVPVVDMDGADSFSVLVKLLKVANKEDILSAFDTIVSESERENSEVPESIFIDALMVANSGESIEAVVELIKSHKLSNSLTISWFNNLGKAKNPTKKAVFKASNLLNDRVLKAGYLGVGALLRQYQQDTHDYTSSEVEKTLSNLVNPLKKVVHGPLSSNDEDLIIASLKGLGYAQYINSDIEDLIIQIIMDKNVIQRIRAAALNMVKIYANNSKVVKVCETIFTDYSEDSELRILAFKVFAINPSNYKASVIKTVLDDRNTQLQIQAYILSYLSNLQTTADEDKLNQKIFYEGIKTMSSKKSLNDILRYSQNLEYYHQCPILNSGVLLDADVIYSYKTFLARSSSASLKGFIFGRRHDLIDFDVRIENLEPLLENLFGPEGYFAKSKGSTYDDVKNYVTQAINYAKGEQNAVDSESSTKQACENIPEEEMKKIYVDITLKLFGNDLGWFSFQGRECQITYQHIIDAILDNFDNSLTDKKNIELNLRQQTPIIDFEKKYATSSGLPVALKIHATSAVKLNISTMFDLDCYLENPGNSNFAFRLMPSASLVFNSLLTIDGYTVDVGYKISSSLHTSTGSHFSLKTIQNQSFKMVYGLPLKVMDILTIKSGAFSIVQEKGSESNEIPLTSTNVDRHSYTRAFEHFKNTVGLSYYVDYNFPWNGELKSLLPFYGPSSFSLKMFKDDENLTEYVLIGSYDITSPKLKHIKFIFVTPNTNIKRGLELVVVYDTTAHKTLFAEFKTPLTKKILQATLVDSNEQKTIEVKYIDGSQHIFSAGVKCEEMDDETIKYSPIFEAKYSTEMSTTKQRHYLVPKFDVDGYVLVKRNVNSDNNYPSKLTLRNVAIVTDESRHSLQGSLTFENNKVSGDVILTANSVTINMNGLLSGDYPLLKLDLKLDMTRNEQANQQLLLETDESYGYKPMSKFVALLYKVKTLNLLTSQEFRFETPYVLLSNNSIRWDDGYFEANCDVLFENSELTTHGYIKTSNLFDTSFNANITILPSTEDTGIFILGLLDHSLVSDPSFAVHSDFKYIQNKNAEYGSSFELNSEEPTTYGRYHLDTKHQSTADSFKYTINYDTYDGSTFTVDMNILTDDISLNINFDSPNPEYKYFMIIHGWSKTGNTYLFDTKVLWPSDRNSNYLNADGTILLNGHHTQMIGNIDFPLAHLENFHVSVKCKPNPEIEDVGFVTVRCISNDKVLLSEKFVYKLTLIDGELYVSGKSIDDESQNVKPITFHIVYKGHDTATQMAYKVSLMHNNQQLTYQKSLHVTKHMVKYEQSNKIDDEEQKIMMELEYDIINAWNWYYKLISEVDSPDVFHYLNNDGQNVLKFNSYIKFNDYSLDEEHTLQISSSEGEIDSYKFKWITNYEKTAFVILYKQREIRGLAHYSLSDIDGGYNFTYSGRMWLDCISNPDSESTLSINTYYALKEGLSTISDITIFVPLFNDKEMGIKTDVQMFKNWENPLRIQLELDIFPNKNQALKLLTSLNRTIQDSGVLYSALVSAQSDGMKLYYALKDSIYVSREKWAKYLDARFIDADNIIRPLELHFELVPRGFTNKLNIFDITVIDIDSSIIVKDGVLNTKSKIKYNGHPYSFEILLTSNPSFKFIMGWENKMGSCEQLMVEGSIVMDESAIISATRIQNNGNDVIPVGYIMKFLDEENWWVTNNQLSTEQSNEIWQSLKGQFIEIFISVHSNTVNIMSVAKNQRKLRLREVRKAYPQYRTLMKYACDEFRQIHDEVLEDNYIRQIPMMIQDTTEAVFSDVIDFMNHNSDYFKNSIRHLNECIGKYSKKLYNYYSDRTNVLLNKLEHKIDELINQVELTLLDLFKQLNLYTDEPVNDMQSSEPRSVKEYYNKIMDTFMKAIEKLEDTINDIKDLTENFIKKLPLYDMLHDEIEKLKTYPYKDHVWEKIHNYLQDLENSAPTRDFASFVNALDKYINNIIHDKPVSQREIVTLRNKGLIVVKSMIFDFSNYVDHDRAINIFNALRKLTTFCQTILHLASPNTFKYPTNENLMLFDFNEYNMQLYHSYLNPSNIIPPFDVHSVIIDFNNIITYNGKPYSFMPNTGCYTLVEDFVTKKFSILAYYEQNILTKISISIYNGENYILLSGGSITVNGKDANFPLINDNLKTWRDVYLFGIDVAVGVSIKCTLDLNIVQVSINGYYYGRVHGLLGSMNQDPSFDLNLPNREIANDMTSFLLAYGQKGNAEPVNINLPQTDETLCSSLFSGTSSLKPFFSTITPVPYRAICNQIVSTATSAEADSLNKACLVAKAFVSMARQKHMSSCNIPDMCITTSIHERTIDATTNVQISDQNDVADVIILFEEVVEIEQTFSDLLNPFIKKVTNNLKSKGINDVKFILIGYSGKSTDSEVHMYTTNDDNGYTKLLSDIPKWTESQTTVEPETSRLQSQLMHSFRKVMDKNSKDKAYRLSADYPFRANAVKVVLSIAQSLYSTQESVSQYTFSYVTSWYLKQDIKFYLIAPINLKDATDEGIFGASGVNMIYTITSPNGKYSDDVCTFDESLETNLAIETSGAIYDSRFFTYTSRAQLETFLNSLCGTIADRSDSDKVIQKSCSSSLYNGMMPYTKCVVVKN